MGAGLSNAAIRGRKYRMVLRLTKRLQQCGVLARDITRKTCTVSVELGSGRVATFGFRSPPAYTPNGKVPQHVYVSVSGCGDIPLTDAAFGTVIAVYWAGRDSSRAVPNHRSAMRDALQDIGDIPF